MALRYYDPARDYQPGMQHADGDNREVRTYQFPGALQANDARELVSRARSCGTAQSDNLYWRTGELDPALGPGSLVTLPDFGESLAGNGEPTASSLNSHGTGTPQLRGALPIRELDGCHRIAPSDRQP